MVKIITEYYNENEQHTHTSENVVSLEEFEMVLDNMNLSNKEYGIVDGGKALVGGTLHLRNGGWGEVRVEF